MRMMLRFTIPAEKGTDAVADGSIGRAFDSLFEQVSPEAAYFFVENGKRAGEVFFEVEDVAMLPQIAEPLFRDLSAAVDFVPVLTPEDLRRGLGTLTS